MGRVATRNPWRLGHRRGNLDDEARIEGLGNQVFPAQSPWLLTVGRHHHFALFGPGQFRNSLNRRRCSSVP
jgi:hypothetical protein